MTRCPIVDWLVDAESDYDVICRAAAYTDFTLTSSYISTLNSPDLD